MHVYLPCLLSLIVTDNNHSCHWITKTYPRGTDQMSEVVFLDTPSRSGMWMQKLLCLWPRRNRKRHPCIFLHRLSKTLHHVSGISIWTPSDNNHSCIFMSWFWDTSYLLCTTVPCEQVSDTLTLLGLHLRYYKTMSIYLLTLISMCIKADQLPPDVTAFKTNTHI